MTMGDVLVGTAISAGVGAATGFVTGCVAGAIGEGAKKVKETISNRSQPQISSVQSNSNDQYIPTDTDGNPIPLEKQTVNGQDIPLPDPSASGPHTTLGGATSSTTGETYLQSATFPEGTWPPANGQNVPWSEVHWTNHGRGDHSNPHQHIFTYDSTNGGGWFRGDNSIFRF